MAAQYKQAATDLFARACAGDSLATAELTPVLYRELRGLARRLLSRERPGHTLQPTALVHEAYLRLIDENRLADGQDQQARLRFLGMAANAMRQVLIQHARQRLADKRGGRRQRVTMEDDVAIALPVEDETLLDVDAALRALESINARLARTAELRLFGGLSVRDLAPVLDVSLATAKADWALARAWLSKLLLDHAGGAGA
ncbi:MAG: RNA polymerase subunit sigma-70 [Planctomycetes bacterium]|nr:RNA polymerase subunit sigma-70 [Planctomycetota bacterium]